MALYNSPIYSAMIMVLYYDVIVVLHYVVIIIKYNKSQSNNNKQPTKAAKYMYKAVESKAHTQSC